MYLHCQTVVEDKLSDSVSLLVGGFFHDSLVGAVNLLCQRAYPVTVNAEDI